jgi:hypothetical protein
MLFGSIFAPKRESRFFTSAWSAPCFVTNWTFYRIEVLVAIQWDWRTFIGKISFFNVRSVIMLDPQVVQHQTHKALRFLRCGQ